jgi:hypothetical protein
MIPAPQKYQSFNNQSVKFPSYVMVIDGYEFILGTTEIGTKLLYGDNVKYGQSFIYGGIRPIEKQLPIFDLQNSTNKINQVHEQEQGKATISTLQICVIDYLGEMTKLISPGVIIDDVMGKTVEFWGGFSEISFPHEYVKLFRGYITNVRAKPCQVIFDLSDPSGKQRTQCFVCRSSKLGAEINSSETMIPIVSTAGFFESIANAIGVTDATVKLGVRIGDEFIQYTGISGNSLTGCTRAAFQNYGGVKNVASSHDSGEEVVNCIVIEDLAINIALKTMLSGLGTWWKETIEIQHIGLTGLVSPNRIDNSIRLKKSVDSYGIVVGDFVKVSTIGQVFTVEEIYDENTIIVSPHGILVDSLETDALLSHRSKYDTYPVNVGLGMTPDDVDIARFEYWRDSFLGSQVMGFCIDETENDGKTFIEKELLLPICAYSLTRSGRRSMGLTHPPLAVDTLDVIDDDAIVDPQNIEVNRGFNNRRFFNEIFYKYDHIRGDFTSMYYRDDSESISRFGASQVKTLPISSRGFRTHLGGPALVAARAYRFLQRYRFGCEEISLSVSWGRGHLHEAGDIVVLNDTGHLLIPNTDDGTRQIKNRPMEILERNVGVRDAKVQLKLLSKSGFELTDRYAVISPSSVIRYVGSDYIDIDPSFGKKYSDFEYKKWNKLLGYRIRVFSIDYSRDSIVFLKSQDETRKERFYVTGTLDAEPGDIVRLAPYYDADRDQETLSKNVYFYVNPTLKVVSGSSMSVFEVDDASGLIPGSVVMVRSLDWNTESVESKVSTIVGNVVTLKTEIGFVPEAGQLVELVGYVDGGAPYRII